MNILLIDERHAVHYLASRSALKKQRLVLMFQGLEVFGAVFCAHSVLCHECEDRLKEIVWVDVGLFHEPNLPVEVEIIRFPEATAPAASQPLPEEAGK